MLRRVLNYGVRDARARRSVDVNLGSSVFLEKPVCILDINNIIAVECFLINYM